MMRAIAAALWVIVIGQALLAQSGQFGEAVSGIQVALVNDAGEFSLQMKNGAVSPIQTAGAFAWLLVVESRDSAWFSEKLSLETQGPVPAGKVASVPVHMSGMKFYPYVKGMKVVDGYPQREGGDGDGDEVRTFASLPQSARVQAIVSVRAEGERISTKSRAVPMVAPQAASQPAEGAALLQQFRRNAFSAQAAHARAVRLGAQVAPMLEEGLKDPSMPGFGRMWIATALVDLGGETARKIAPVLAADSMEGVRLVLAFHGPKLKDAKVDEVILDRARSGTEPMFTAWAARGFAQQKRPFPRKLVDAAFNSKEPRARAEVAHVLAASTDRADLDRLGAMFADENELVRVAAADSVRENTLKSAELARAMVRALDMPGESAKARIVEALAKVWQKPWVYDMQAAEESRVSVLREIRGSELAK